MRALREEFGVERSHFHRFLLLFGEHEFLRSQRLHFLREVAQQQGEPPPIRPLLDAGLCIMSLRGSSRRAAAVCSRAFWEVFREKVFSSAAATPCWALLPREDREARRLDSGDVLALLRQCRPQPGLQLLEEFHRRERRRGDCCWNVEVSFWVESFDMGSSALAFGCCPGVALPGGTGRSLRCETSTP